MITKDTTISIKFCADRFAADPHTGIRFQVFDENGNPLPVQYDMQGLLSIDDERLSAINISLTCIKALFNNISETRNKQLEQLAKEIGQITGAPTKPLYVLDGTRPTGMSTNIPGAKDNPTPLE